MREELAYSWKSDAIIFQENQGFLSHGTYIWIINWPLIPPHIGMSINGRYYSITINECQRNKPIDGLWRLFYLKKKPVFFVELSPKLSFEQCEIDKAFSGSIVNGETCLEPLNELLFGDRKQFEMVGELLHVLELSKLINTISVPNYTENDYVGIRKYTKKDVIEFIGNKTNQNVASI
jgi:hypothetical protein